MKEMIILITMFFADPSYTGKDAITIDSYNGKPLIFTDADKCEKWIWDDLENLKKYAKTIYPEAVAVKKIQCVYKKEVQI